MPKLIVKSGPLRGRTLALEGERASIGRAMGSEIRIESAAVSRRHCEIRHSGSRYQIRDCSSANGTFVNQIAITERYLRDGDEITVGDSTFVFVEDRPPATPPAATPAGGATGIFFETAKASGGDTDPVEKSWPIGPAGSPTTSLSVKLPSDEAGLAPEARRRGREFDFLIEIGAALASAKEGEDVAGRLLQRLLEAAPAERAAIVGAGAAAGPPVAVAGRARDSSRLGGPLHGGMIDKVIRDDRPQFSNYLPPVGVGRAPTARAALAAPLRVGGELRGVLYLDSADPFFNFDESQLQLVAAVANLCAPSLFATERLRKLERENRRLRAEVDADRRIVGESAPIRRLHEFVERVAAADSTVLIEGESGTGKELVARAIHRSSPRADAPFIAVNCAALSESLVEAELFGHEKGAFTGADRAKPGKIELAEGGTLFLDEIGELPAPMQAKLLRVLQEREYERVGGVRSLRANIRVLAATNRELAAEVRKGAFREDLYYRLNVVSARTPALRERREDIPLLARHFLEKFRAHLGRPSLEFAPETLARLERYDWPGNVRELANAVERAAVLGGPDLIRPGDLPTHLVEEFRPKRSEGEALDVGPYHDAVADFKRRLVLRAVEEAGGVIAQAAQALGLHPNNLHRLIRNLDLKDEVAALAGRR